MSAFPFSVVTDERMPKNVIAMVGDGELAVTTITAPVKCWRVETTDPYDFDHVYVCAETRNKAIVAALDADESGNFHEMGYINLRATRLPQFDGGFTVRQLIADGCWFECAGCGQKIDRDYDGEWPRYDRDKEQEYVPFDPVYEGDSVWCCAQCRAHAFRNVDNDLPALQPETVLTEMFFTNEW